jgi:hypothetical protein
MILKADKNKKKKSYPIRKKSQTKEKTKKPLTINKGPNN